MYTTRPDTNRPGGSARRFTPVGTTVGFTLIEMVVVVAIILVLLGIAVPVSTGLIKSQKANATQATMQIMQVGFESVGQDAMGTYNLKIDDPSLLPQYDPSYQSIFGKFPPSPTSAINTNRTPGASLPDEFVALPDQDNKTKGTEAELLGRFNLLLDGNDTGAFVDWGKADVTTPDYLTIELCVFWMRETSPSAKQQLDALMSKGIMTNKDQDWVVHLNGNRKDLFEINDAWGQPLRYSVQTPFKAAVNVPPLKLQWELRSAGADGFFSPTYDDTVPDNSFFDLKAQSGSDDVVVRGPE